MNLSQKFTVEAKIVPDSKLKEYLKTHVEDTPM